MFNLADPFLKTTRAKEHLDALRHELSSFYESNPYEITAQDDIPNQRYLMYVTVNQAPERLSLTLGDFLHCLRSSLDQLVWCLAKTPGTYPLKTQFPIMESDNSKSRKRFAEQTAGVPLRALEIIRSLQPYNAGDKSSMRSHLLRILNELCNIDKHTRVLAYGAEIKWYFRKNSPLAAVANFDDADEKGRGILSIPLSLKNDMAIAPSPTFKVVFGDMSKQIECDIEEIKRVYDFVALDVLPRFARL